ncbi:MAG: glutamate-cysteine ligase family protein [SAR324 cluster bacterium]|nr:glutamate-cysteine ligase family protein [SAR324 cluster bacterium]
MSQNLPAQEFLDYFYKAEKPQDQWKLGLEQEVIGFDIETLTRLEYSKHIQPILNGFAERFGWTPYSEGGNIIGLKKDGSSITLEPGAQLELSLKPIGGLAGVELELNTYREQLKILSTEQSVLWLSMGYDPFSNVDDIGLVPKKRYEIMADYLPAFGEGARHMMRMTATAQANFDYSSEEDMRNKMKVAVALSSVMSIIFATSPIRNSELSGCKSSRNWTWRNLDSRRTGFLDFVFEEGFGYQRYIDYVSQIPMMVLEREDGTQDLRDTNFVDYYHKGKNGLTYEKQDWVAQLGGTFPVARLRNAIETRTCDAGPVSMLLGQAAFWKGLLYDPEVLLETVAWVESSGIEIFKKIHERGYLTGFDCLVKDPECVKILKTAIDLSKKGLEKQSKAGEESESKYLDQAFANFEAKESVSDRLIKNYTNSDKKGILALLEKENLIFA